MRILICVDIEGVAGVVHTEQTRPGHADYERARQWMTAEANAAVAGAFDGGATEVQVADGHGNFRNLWADELDPRATLVSGKPRLFGMLGSLEADFGGLMLVGFHARAQAAGVLAHTINSAAFAGIWLNGIEVGEAGLYGALAGERGVPVIFASGDDAFVAETRPQFPHSVFVQTKQTLGRIAAISLSPAAACTAIRAGAHAAMSVIDTAQPLRLDTPVHIRVRTQTTAHADLFAQWPALERADDVTVTFSAASVEHAVRMINCLSAMAQALR